MKKFLFLTTILMMVSANVFASDDTPCEATNDRDTPGDPNASTTTTTGTTRNVNLEGGTQPPAAD